MENKCIIKKKKKKKSENGLQKIMILASIPIKVLKWTSQLDRFVEIKIKSVKVNKLYSLNQRWLFSQLVHYCQ